MRRFKVSSFIRLPYEDLKEVEGLPEFTGKIAGFWINSIEKDKTNARIPLTNDQFNELMEEVLFVGLRK